VEPGVRDAPRLTAAPKTSSYIEWRAQLGVEDNVETRVEPGEEESGRYRLLVMRRLFQDSSLILPGPVDAGSSEVLLLLQSLIVWNEGMICARTLRPFVCLIVGNSYSGAASCLLRPESRCQADAYLR
jgi:hypothetical protein